jgi:hypothetical protein
MPSRQVYGFTIVLPVDADVTAFMEIEGAQVERVSELGLTYVKLPKGWMCEVELNGNDRVIVISAEPATLGPRIPCSPVQRVLDFKGKQYWSQNWV